MPNINWREAAHFMLTSRPIDRLKETELTLSGKVADQVQCVVTNWRRRSLASLRKYTIKDQPNTNDRMIRASQIALSLGHINRSSTPAANR
jgi:hypothetical protein